MFVCVRNAVAAAIAATALSACVAVPVVSYNKIEKPADAAGVTDSFYLAQSVVTIDKTEEVVDKAKNTKTQQYVVSSKPVASGSYKVGIRPEKSARVTTKVNIVKIDNTDLVSSVGIETTDNTASLITSIGGAATKVVALLAALAPAPGQGTPCIADDAFPVRLDISVDRLASVQPNQKMTFAATGAEAAGGCIEVSVGDYPRDAAPSLPFDQPTSNFYYASCRDLKVSFTQDRKKVEKTVRIADPNRVQFVELPYKGSVTMHSECGASVKTESTAPQNSAIGIVDALATQAKAIKDAIDASKK